MNSDDPVDYGCVGHPSFLSIRLCEGGRPAGDVASIGVARIDLSPPDVTPAARDAVNGAFDRGWIAPPDGLEMGPHLLTVDTEKLSDRWSGSCAKTSMVIHWPLAGYRGQACVETDASPVGGRCVRAVLTR